MHLQFCCMPSFPIIAALIRPIPAHPNPHPLVLAVVVFAYARDAQPLLSPRCTYYALFGDAAPFLVKQEKRKKIRGEKERHHNPTTETKLQQIQNMLLFFIYSTTLCKFCRLYIGTTSLRYTLLVYSRICTQNLSRSRVFCVRPRNSCPLSQKN